MCVCVSVCVCVCVGSCACLFKQHLAHILSSQAGLQLAESSLVAPNLTALVELLIGDNEEMPFMLKSFRPAAKPGRPVVVLQEAQMPAWCVRGVWRIIAPLFLKSIKLDGAASRSSGSLCVDPHSSLF
jgi:hypothetical protein